MSSDAPATTSASPAAAAAAPAAASISILSSIGSFKTIDQVGPYLHKAMEFVDTVHPHVMKAYQQAVIVYAMVPQGLTPILFGLMLCFFGGTFVLTIAAAEAMFMMIWTPAQATFHELWEEFKTVKKALDEDAKKNADNGKLDSQSLSTHPSELLLRKFQIFMTSCQHPEKITYAFGIIATGFAGVLATLQSQFVRTITLGASLGQSLEKLSERLVRPHIERALDPKYHKWISPSLSTVVKTLCVSLAMILSRVISSVQSSIRGGLMISRAAIALAQSHGYLTTLDLTSSPLDEILGYFLALLGIHYQITHFFTVGFPFNLFLWPATMFEASLTMLVAK